MQPVPGYGISTPYGKRGSYWSCDPDAYGNGIHTGADFAAPQGTKIVAARGGRAVYCNHGSSFGYHQLEIVPGDGTRDFYAHMPSRAVPDGSQVEAGQKIGVVGQEGNVTGPHLHFERHSVPSGPWSCSVVRDPAPSINYQPAGSGGSGSGTGQDEDMPEYGSAQRRGKVNLKGGSWYPIAWDDVNVGDCFEKGSEGIKVGGSRYVATLVAHISGREGATVRTDWVEREGGETVESSAQVSHDKDHLTDTRVGKVQTDRVLRARVMCDSSATLEGATVTIVYW